MPVPPATRHISWLVIPIVWPTLGQRVSANLLQGLSEVPILGTINGPLPFHIQVRGEDFINQEDEYEVRAGRVRAEMNATKKMGNTDGSLFM